MCPVIEINIKFLTYITQVNIQFAHETTPKSVAIISIAGLNTRLVKGGLITYAYGPHYLVEQKNFLRLHQNLEYN